MADESKTADVLATVADLSEADRALASLLVELGQAHIFAGWAAGVDTAQRQAFFASLRETDAAYPGGLRAYADNARKFLAVAASGANPLDGYVPEVPEGINLMDATSAQVAEMEDLALPIIKDCAFVLVAGGLGERLGYNGIKVELPTTLASRTCYLEMYVKQILTLQALSNKAAGVSEDDDAYRRIPLAIMTSDDTHRATARLLRRRAYFGMDASQVILMKQEKVPALADNEARFAMTGKYELLTKPHGHGDVHTLLAGMGLAKRWAEEKRKYVCFFQDTNAACFEYMPRSLGAALQSKCEVVSMCIPRKAGEAIGAITTLRAQDGSSITTCVEYNQLAPLLVATVNKDGDVNDPKTGYSPFPGNVNQLIFEVAPYASVLQRTGGLVPEFVNPKYTDATCTAFKAPTRLECMMQDHPKVLGSDARVGFVTLPVCAFSPVKNSIAAGVDKSRAGLPPQCALSGELDVYNTACDRLRAMGARVAEPKPFTAAGITYPRAAGVVLSPRMTATAASMAAAFPTPDQVSISQRSFLVVKGGGDVTIHSLQLDGALEIRVADGVHADIRGLVVTNAGWDLVPLEGGDDAVGAGSEIPDSLRIRGYRLVRAEHAAVVFDEEGRHDQFVVHRPASDAAAVKRARTVAAKALAQQAEASPEAAAAAAAVSS